MTIAGSLEWKRTAWPRSESSKFYKFSVTVVGSNAYVFGGVPRERVDMFVYSLTKRKWKRFPGPPSQNGHAMILVNDRFYMIGGLAPNRAESTSIVAYDLLMHTTEVVVDKYVNFQPGAVFVESRGDILIVDRARGRFVVFNVRTKAVNELKVKGDFYRIASATLVQSHGKIFLYSKHATGTGILRILTLQKRNTATVSTIDMSPLPVFKANMQLCTVNGYVMGFGGIRSGRRACDQLFIFDPARKEWAEARREELSTLECSSKWWPQAGTARTVAFNGKLILFGGFNNNYIGELKYTPFE